MTYIRKEKKKFGKNSQIEGLLSQKDHVLLAEDLMTDGGSKLKFTKDGKIWTTKGHLINHLNQFNTFRFGENVFKQNINNWIIEEHKLDNPNTTDLLDFVSKGDYKLQYDILVKNDK